VQLGSDQREGLDRMLKSGIMERHIAETGVDPRSVWSENPPLSRLAPSAQIALLAFSIRCEDWGFHCDLRACAPLVCQHWASLREFQ
jgi:hypothetical protein